jgi:glutamate--cysteine ligase
LPALWAGLFYDRTALDGAVDLVADWTREERETLRSEVARLGLRAPFRGGTVRDIAQAMVRLSREGLGRRALRDSSGADEGQFLDTLAEIAESGVTPAETLLDRYAKRWSRRIDPVFTEEAY